MYIWKWTHCVTTQVTQPRKNSTEYIDGDGQWLQFFHPCS